MGSLLTGLLLLVVVFSYGCDSCYAEFELPPENEPLVERSPRPFELPVSRSETRRLVSPAVVRITKGTIDVDGQPLVELRNGVVPGEVKSDGGEGYFITRLSKVLREKIPPLPEHAPCPDENVGILTIEADVSTSARLLTEVLHSSIWGTPFESIQLAVLNESGKDRAVRMCQVQFGGQSCCWQRWKRELGYAPMSFYKIRAIAAGREEGELPLNLLVGIGDGFVVTEHNHRLPGMADGEYSINIPLLQESKLCPSKAEARAQIGLGPPACAYDYEALGRVAQSAKDLHPDALSVIVSMGAGVDYETLVKTVDALQGSKATPLFPLVAFTSGA